MGERGSSANSDILKVLEASSATEREAYLQAELEVAATQPFNMIVRHFLMQYR